jgi:Ca-activated chloride channel family protein
MRAKSRLVKSSWLGFLVAWLGFFVLPLSAQQNQKYKPELTRILVVLDGSGSMKENWNGRTKFQTAAALLSKVIESIEQKNSNVEFAVRVFGYQFPREQKNCSDSKLLVPFSKQVSTKIKTVFSSIAPKGMSPIAYSLQQCANDFPEGGNSLNAIILVTDGNENCDGNICLAVDELAKKHIALKPFIVGLSMDENSGKQYNCAGQFYNSADEASLYKTVGVIIKQTLNTTTAQVNLLNSNATPSVTNIPFTLYDHYTGKVLYNYVHTLTNKDLPDTLFLDPVSVYDLVLHTTPAIRKSKIELEAGKHNVIALDVPLSEVKWTMAGATYANNTAQILLRSSAVDKEIFSAFEWNESNTFLTNRYAFEALTLPRLSLDTAIASPGSLLVPILNTGLLTLIPNADFIASVYAEHEGKLQLQARMNLNNGKISELKLQPGKYTIVYQSVKSYDSETTKSKQFTIEEGRTNVIYLQL